MNGMIISSVALTIGSIFVILYENFFAIVMEEIEEKENLKAKKKSKRASCLSKIIISIIFMIITIVMIVITQNNSNSKSEFGIVLNFFFSTVTMLPQLFVVSVMWIGDLEYISDNLKLYYTCKKNEEGFFKAFMKSFFAICVSVVVPLVTLGVSFLGVLNYNKFS